MSVGKSDAGSTQTFYLDDSGDGTEPPDDESDIDGAIDSITGVAYGDVIWIKSISEDDSKTLIYAIEVVEPNNDATLAGVSIDSTSGGESWAVTTVTAAFDNDFGIAAAAAVPILIPTLDLPIDIVITATATDTGATVEYGCSTDGTDWDDGDLSAVEDQQYIVVKVTAEDGTTVLYYVWQVEDDG